MEQLFIAKTKTDWQCFDISRPISKSSPLYKLFDTILNQIIWKELFKKKASGVNINQSGFVPGMGCDLNILRMMEDLKAKQEQDNGE